jgi:hypothetical protein
MQVPRTTNNVVGCGSVLDALLFTSTTEGKELETYCFVASKSLWTPPPSNARQVAYSSHVDPRPWPISPMS